MPYEIRKYGRLYKVYKKGTAKSYSKKGLPQRVAERQLKALYANEDDDMEGGGFFTSIMKKAFEGLTNLIVSPPNFDASKVRYGWLRRPIDMPSLHDLSEMVASTYSTSVDDIPEIDGYYVITKTPTATIFGVKRHPRLFIVALRGTSFTDLKDVFADLAIVKNIVNDASTYRAVRNSARYREDVDTIKEFQTVLTNYYNVKNAKIYAVGHSLSGAIIDEMLEDGLIQSAVSFNPAIERQNFNYPNDNHRVYLECDILYNLLGRFITNGNVEVIAKANPSGPDAGPIDTAKGSITCHNIKTVVPLMVGKANNNNGIEYNMNEAINFPASFSLRDRFKPIGVSSGKAECEAIRQQPITMEYRPTMYNGRQYSNPSAAKQAENYDKCVAGEYPYGDKNKPEQRQPEFSVRPVLTQRRLF